jgi:hypothetical protein
VPAELTAALSEKRAGAATAPRRKKSMAVATLFITMIVLGGLVIVAYVFWPGGAPGSDGSSASGTPGGHTPTSDEAWVNHQLAQATQAERSSDYAKAIEILRTIANKPQTPDATRKTMESRIHAIQDKIKQVEDEKQAALTKLAARLKQAQSLADRQDFENALLALNNIGEEDRRTLALQHISVTSMEADFHAKQDKWNAEQNRLKQQEEALEAQVETARAAEKEGKLKEAIAQYKRLAADFPAAMVLKRVDVQAKVTDLETKLASAATTEPTKEPATKPKATTAAEINKEVAEIVDQADALGKQEKFEQARLKLEEIVRNYEEKYWPEKLKDRIKQLKDREEALKFFGIGGNKK